jgi:adenylate cyclase
VKLTRFKELSWRRPVESLVIGALVFASILFLHRSGSLLYFELKTYDRWLQFQPRARTSPVKIVIVGIDDDDIENALHLSQISDLDLKNLITHLQDFGASVIGVDLVRDIPVPATNPGQAADKAADKAAATIAEQIGGCPTSGGRYPDIVAIMYSRPIDIDKVETVIIGPPRGRTPTCPSVGLANIYPDDDGVVRRGLIDMTVSDAPGHFLTIPSFPMLVATAALGKGPHPIERTRDNGDSLSTIRLGKLVLKPMKPGDGPYVNAQADDYEMLMDYKGPSTFTEVNYRKAIDPVALSPGQVQNAIVLIGKMSMVDKDYFTTPMQRNEYGVRVHAQLIEQIVRSAQYGASARYSAPSWVAAAWLGIWCLLGTFVGFLTLRPMLFGGVLAVGLLTVPAASFGLFCLGVWVPTVAAAMALYCTIAFVTAYTAHTERANNAANERLIAQFNDKRVRRFRKQLLRDGKIVPEKIWATVLFTDVRSFGEICAKVPVEKLMPWLNEYMEKMSSIVQEHDGFVNKYIGDAIMAVYGAPIASKTIEARRRDARNALLTALKMRRELHKLNADWDVRGQPMIQMRIGIYSGEVVAGSIGSASRLEYTVTGDIVNCANRLESLEKDTLVGPQYTSRGCRILIGQSTLDLIGAEFVTESLGQFNLKGQPKPVNVYGVCDSSAAQPDSAAA